MPWLIQMAGFALLLVGIAVALWVSLWLLLFLFAIGVLAVAWSHLKSFLLAKGILNPTPGIPPAPMEPEVTVIEGDFEHVKIPREREHT